jgi:hypothetical protein
VLLFGTDQRITSGPAAKRPHSKAEYMTAPERFADSQIPLAPRAPSIHGPLSLCAMPDPLYGRPSRHLLAHNCPQSGVLAPPSKGAIAAKRSTPSLASEKFFPVDLDKVR